MPIYPPPAPVVTNGNQLTVSTMLSQPRLIQRRISDMTLRKDVLGLLFADNGLTSSGSTAFQQLTANDLFSGNRSERIAPGAEYPKLGFGNPTLRVATIAKQGGEFDVTYEMRDRDQMGLFDQYAAVAANTVTRDTQALAINVLNAAITEHSRTAAAASTWATIAGTTTANATAAASIYAQIASAITEPEDRELPYEYDTVIMHPSRWRVLLAMAGERGAAGVREQLAAFGIDTIWVTNRQTADRVKFVAKGMVGGREWEGVKGVETKVRDEEARDTFVVKVRERVMAYVTDPFAILELTGV